jgi:hypothetical protein
MNRRDLLEQSTAALALMAGVRPTRRFLPMIRFGCAAITWDGNERQAITDISA